MTNLESQDRVARPPIASRLAHLPARLATAALLILLLTSVPSPGQGNVGVGTNIPPMSRGPGISRPAPGAATARPTLEEPQLVLAMARLNAKVKAAKGDGAEIWNAISAQTKVAVKTLRQQRTSTKMNPGELLVANSLATTSGNSFAKILALRTKAGTWSQVARELRIEPATLAASVTAASASPKNGPAPTS